MDIIDLQSGEDVLVEDNITRGKPVEEVDGEIGEDDEVICELEERAKYLQDTMKLLRQQLNAELHLLKQEQEEYDHLFEEKILQDFRNASEAAKSASEAYTTETNNYLAEIANCPSNSCLAQTENALTENFNKKLEEAKRVCAEEMKKLLDYSKSIKPVDEMMSLLKIDEKSDFHQEITKSPPEITSK